MIESTFWSNRIRPMLNEMGLDPIRIENGLAGGTPDTNYTCGWIELKYVPQWPVRLTTCLPIDWQWGQGAWLARRWYAGGLSFLMVGVSTELLIFDGWIAKDIQRDGMTREQMGRAALWAGSNTGPYPDVKAILQGDTDSMSLATRARFYRARSMMTTEELASQLGWTPGQVFEAEHGAAEDLLDQWET